MCNIIARSNKGTLANRAKNLAMDSRADSSVSYAIILGFIVFASSVMMAAVGVANKSVFTRLGANDEVSNGAGLEGTAATSQPSTFAAASGAAKNAARIVWVSLVVAMGSCLGALLLGKQLGRRSRRTAQGTDPGDQQHEAMPTSLQLRIFAKRQLIYRILESEEQLLSGNHLVVRCVMTRELATVLPDATADEVGRCMTQLRVRHLLVLEECKLIGVISDRDLHTRSGKTAREIMTRNPVTVSPSTPVERAVTLLMTRGFSCLPVVEGDEVCGVLTSTDLMMTLQCLLRLMDEIARQISRDPPGNAGVAAVPSRETSEEAA